MKETRGFFRFLLAHKIGTWLTQDDFSTINYFLSELKEMPLSGGILEIGSYKGGCIPVLARHMLPQDELILLDLFDSEPSTLLNYEEIKTSYEPIRILEIARIIELLGVSGNTKIIKDNSMNIGRMSKDNYFKMIHVDGSHLYEFVKSDLEFALENLNKENGVIVVDDYRAQHCPGVAMAIWEIVASKRARVLVLGPAKIYLCLPEANWNVQKISHDFLTRRIQHKIGVENDFNYIFIKSKRENIYRINKMFRILVSLISQNHLVWLISRVEK